MKTERAAQEILHQWQVFGWTMLVVLVVFIVVALVRDGIEKRRGEH